MKHHTPRQGPFFPRGRRLLLVLCVTTLSVGGIVGRGMPVAFAKPPPPTVTVPRAPTKITPVLTWATPAAITVGTALGTDQLNASTSIPGTFTYSSPAGTMLGVGTDLVTVLFTPLDTADYNAASALVYLTVLAAPPVTATAIAVTAILSPTAVPLTATVPLTPATSIPTLVSSVATPLPTPAIVPALPITLVIHNNARTEVGGRTQACDLAGNTNGAKEIGCEIVSSVSAAGALVTYTVTFADGSTDHFTDTADSRGHSLHAFAVAYVPTLGAGQGTVRSVAYITVQATLADGTVLGPMHVRFAVMR